MAKFIKDFSLRCAFLLLAIGVTFCVSIAMHGDTVYADESELPKDTLLVKGAKEDISWEYGYNTLDNWQTYTLGTPVERLGNYNPRLKMGKILAWTTTIEDFEKCGPLTKVSITKTEDGTEVASCVASDSTIGIQKKDCPVASGIALNQIWPGGEEEHYSNYNGIVMNNMIINEDGSKWVNQPYVRDENTYVAVQGLIAKIVADTSYDFTVILYFNGSENAPVIPEDVQAVIDAIDAIGEVTENNYTEKETLATEAKVLYDALESEELKAQVTNYETLTAALASIDSFKLDAAKTAAKQFIDEKYDLTKYSGDELAKLQKAISDANAAIDDAVTIEAVEAARDAGIEEADKVKTDEQIAADTLAAAKSAAKQAIDDKYDLTKYSGEELAKLQKAISDAKAAIDAAVTVEAVEAARDAGIEEADKAKTDEQIAAAKKAEEIKKKKAAAKSLKVKSLKIKVKSRKFTLTWKKTKGASGYQIQYRKKGTKKFSSLKTTKLKVMTKKLKKNKKYQFRVRTYVKIEGKLVYGKWTKVKAAKCC